MNRNERHRINYRKLRSMGIPSNLAQRLKFASQETIEAITNELKDIPNYRLAIIKAIDKVMNDGKN